MDLSITDLMESYGAWVRDDGDRMGYSSPAMQLIRLAPEVCKDDVKPARRAQTVVISDDVGLMIDRAMQALARYSLLLHDVIKLRFVDGRSVNQIAVIYCDRGQELLNKSRVTRYDIRDLVNEGLGNLNGMLVLEFENNR